MKCGTEFEQPNGSGVFNGISLALKPQERKLAVLLLNAYSNAEIAKQLGMTERSVKNYFTRMFRRAQIHDGIKRIKLAVILYRQFSWEEQ